MRYKIKDVAKINERAINKKYNGTINYIDTSSVTDNIFNNPKVYSSIKEAPSRARRVVNLGDTIISTVRPNMKHTGFIDKVKYKNCIYSTGFAVVTPLKDRVDPFYLYLVLTNNKNTELLQSIGETSTSTYPSVKPSDIENLEHDFPNINKQKEISTIIKMLENKIYLNNKINTNLLELLDAEFTNQFINSDLPIGKVNDFVSIKRGSSPRPIKNFLSDKGRAWIKISDVTKLTSPFLYDTVQSIKESGIDKSRTIKPGTLILSNSATPGIPIISEILASVHDGWLIVDHYTHMDRNWFYLFFRQMRRQLIARANGSVFNNLKTDIVKDFPVPIAKEEELLKFKRISNPIFDKLDKLQQENIVLSKLKDILLKQYF